MYSKVRGTGTRYKYTGTGTRYRYRYEALYSYIVTMRYFFNFKLTNLRIYELEKKFYICRNLTIVDNLISRNDLT